MAGNLKRLTCLSMGGNPLATLRWYIGRRELNSAYSTRDNYASAELAFMPEQLDNRATLRCEATNVAIVDPMVASREIAVQFPPSFVHVKVRPENPRDGQNATLVCETASSKPAATVTWWSNGIRLDGASETIVDGGENEGFITSSHLTLGIHSNHHGQVVTCQAKNMHINKQIRHDIVLSVSRKCIAG